MQIFNRKFYLILALIFLVELFSLFAYLLPDFNKIAFLIIALLALILSLCKLEYGIWLVFIELFIGSKGYLFFFEYEGLVISIRIALWLIIMSVWLGKIIVNWTKNRTEIKESFFKSSFYFSYFFILFLFIVWGVVNGVLNQNEVNNIFFDFNGWLYFALILPVYSVIKNQQNIDNFLRIFIAAVLWLSLKTFFFLFIFSHGMIGLINELYHWVRLTGVGEITQVQGGFYRVFFQSHIFILAGFFMFLLLIYKMTEARKIKTKKFFIFFAAACIFLSTILISFSRSFWLSSIAGLILLFAYFIWRKYSWKIILQNIASLGLIIIVSFSLILIVVKFPYPRPLGGFAATELLTKRASQISGEAGVSSRWALLPKLLAKIKQNIVLGQGFGATVTYKSSDPRVLQSSPAGEYTTFAFEWGWLDIWLKLGLFGMVFYLFLISKICFSVLRKNFFTAKRIPAKPGKDGILSSEKYSIILGLVFGLAVIVVVSIFSPYMNHPLGIGYLIIVSVILERIKLKTAN